MFPVGEPGAGNRNVRFDDYLPLALEFAQWRRSTDLDCATQHDHHAVGGRADHEYGFADRKITNSDASEKCGYFPTLEVAKQHAFAE